MIKNFQDLDKVDKRYSISGKSYEKIVQKKDPGKHDSFVQRVQNFLIRVRVIHRFYGEMKR